MSDSFDRCRSDMAPWGRSFYLDEDTAMDRCWVSKYAQQDDKGATMFWNNVSVAFRRRPEAMELMLESTSLHNRWVVLQKWVQMYLSAERIYRSKPVSVEADEDALRNIMVLHRKCNQKKDRISGKIRDVPALKLNGALQIMRQ